MHVLISVDMEGIAGVVVPEDVRPGNAEYERNRVLMTEEANAAVRGVFAHSPEARVTVTDAHGVFRNILPESLDRRARLLRGKPRPHGMLAGLDSSVDAVVYVGYHGKSDTGRSVLAHTVHGGVIRDVRCNGTSLGEIGLNTALASHYSAVPVLAVGDESVGAEAMTVAPGITTVEVKKSYGDFAASSLHPLEACERIEAAMPMALVNRDGVQPLALRGAVDLEVAVSSPSMVDEILLVPGMERVDGATVRYRAANIVTAHDVVHLVAVLGASVS